RRGGGRGADALPQDLRNELYVGSESDGGFWVPTQTATFIKQRLFETSDIRGIAQVLTITSDGIEIPVDSHDLPDDGGWVSERGARNETGTPQQGIQRVETWEQYECPQVTQRLLDDSAIDVTAYLNAKIASKMARRENTAFVTGDGIG